MAQQQCLICGRDFSTYNNTPAKWCPEHRAQATRERNTEYRRRKRQDAEIRERDNATHRKSHIKNKEKDNERARRAGAKRRALLSEGKLNCTKCGEELAKPSDSGLCGFCEEELAA